MTNHESRITNHELQRVLVVLPNWFGETLFATPFLRALRRQCPAATVATLGPRRCRDILLASPLVTELIDYEERGDHRSLLAKGRVARFLRRRRFDAAFILRRSLSRSLLLAAAGIPVRVGFANPKSGWLLTHRAQWPNRPLHKAHSYLRLLEAVGLRPEAAPYEYVVRDDERRAARALLRSLGSNGGGSVVVLHPGANWPHKRWPAERFASLGDQLAGAAGLTVVVTGGPEDTPLVQTIARQMRRPPMVVAGRTSIRELAALLELAHLVVSNDTGVLHLAGALRRPLVALYGPTSPTLTGPLGDSERTIVLHHPDCCPQIPCFSPWRPPHPGMEAITVEEVYEAAQQLLGQRAGDVGQGIKAKA